MKKRILFIALLFLSVIIHGQKEQYLTFELGGSGGIGSINYEKSFYKKGALNLIFRTGLSAIPFGSGGEAILIFPVMVHGVLGKNNHKLDLGIGQTPSITLPLSGVFIRMPLSLGYKYEPKEKKYYLRISYTPLVSYLVQFQWEHWAGITYGYKLKSKDK